jgi:hypothetical protein
MIVKPQNLEYITDIRDVIVKAQYEDDHLPCVEIVFRDQKGRFRSGSIMWSHLGPGQVEYYTLHNDIKQDLIASINYDYELEKEIR